MKGGAARILLEQDMSAAKLLETIANEPKLKLAAAGAPFARRARQASLRD